MTDYSGAIVGEYLRRLDVAASALPPDRRAELIAEIADHISHARTSGQIGDEAGLRELLDRLGEPEDIVSEARDPEPDRPGSGPYGATPYPGPGQRMRTPGIGLEIAAVALMTIGSIIPFIGWLAGAALLWACRRFTLPEKILATLVVPFGPFTILIFGTLAGGQTCSTTDSTDSAGNLITGPTTCTGFAFPPWLGIPLLLAAVIGPFVIGGILLKRASDRAAMEPPVPVFAPAGASGPSRWGGLEIAAVLLLSVGGFLLPFVGPIAGLVCAWISTAWTSTEKWVATTIASLALAIPLVALVTLRL